MTPARPDPGPASDDLPDDPAPGALADGADATPGGRPRRGIQSVEVGGQLLTALASQGGPMALKDLAAEAGMPPGKAHPYLVSFGRIGLVAQDAATGRYLLGPLALQLGLISLQQSDPVHVASQALGPLAQEIGQTVAIAVWGTRGATIVRVEPSPAAVHVNMRHGTVFSLADTASGRLFGAYLDPKTVEAMLETERRRGHARTPRDAGAPGMPAARPWPTWKEFSAQLDEVRARGMSRSEGEVVGGINAMAAPVFDGSGRIVLALVAIGATGSFSTEWDGVIGFALKAYALNVSEQLGFRIR
jgi:DNA-binding IclR family transcriptional regulator